ncbi:MAG TPA: GSCFA domain protein [Bacteroides sp.]|nr:GSCFA domain protein [Bacteroides sp.]
MNFFTRVSIPDYPFRIDHGTPVLMMGSCFTDQVGALLNKHLFPVLVNPFGVTYNPLSVQKGLDALLHKNSYTDEDLQRYNDLWFSFDHSTGFSAPRQEDSLQHINREFTRGKRFMESARFLILTWGTSWVYRYNPTGEVVCNCHKIPASRFTRFRLTPEAIVTAYRPLLRELLEKNADLVLILTVSPVRHWKDGAHGNQLSKATLLLAAEALADLFPDRIFYFPSYEVVMDELRDYRFYAEDMLHINEQATRYIWERFRDSLVSGPSMAIIKELQPLLDLMHHRPLHPESVASGKMEQKRKQWLLELKTKHPHLAWENLSSRF